MAVEPFDIFAFLKARPLSWSAISCFEWNPDEWYRRYVLGEREAPTKEMLFGSMIGKKVEKDPSFLPAVVRHSRMEYPFKGVFSKYPLVGFADSLCGETFGKLAEYKTGKKPWDQKRADSHGQLDMYALMNYMMNGVRPQDLEITLVWLPTEETPEGAIRLVEPISPVAIRTRRTMRQALEFGVRIERTVMLMQDYVRARA